MSSLLHASIKLGCRTDEPIRPLTDYVAEGVVSESVANKLRSAGWTTDYQVYRNLVAFSVLGDNEREELRAALNIEEKELKQLADKLRW